MCDTAPPVWHQRRRTRAPDVTCGVLLALEAKELTEASDRPLVRAGGCPGLTPDVRSHGDGSVAVGPRQGLSRAPAELFGSTSRGDEDPARLAKGGWTEAQAVRGHD